MKAVVLDNTGGPEVLTVTEVEEPTPKDDEILIDIKYSAINYADLLARQGLYSWAPDRPYILGLEGAGDVIEVGKNISEVEVGDKVIFAGQKGGYAEKVTVPQDYILKAPEMYNDKENAAFAVTWFTSWVAMHEMARVRSGEVLLVQAAAGGIGTASVQLGLVHGMEVFGTSSKEHKRQRVEELGATAFSYDEFDTKILEMDKRPDCVIETIGGDVFDRSYDILAPMGRIVLVGASGIQLNKWNPISWFKAWRALPRTKMKEVIHRSRGFMGVHIGYLMKYPERLRPKWEELVQTVTEHELYPEIRDDHIFPLSEVSKAHQHIHDRKNIGKVLLDPSK